MRWIYIEGLLFVLIHASHSLAFHYEAHYGSWMDPLVMIRWMRNE